MIFESYKLIEIVIPPVILGDIELNSVARDDFSNLTNNKGLILQVWVSEER